MHVVVASEVIARLTGLQQAVQAVSTDQKMLLVLSRLINQCADNVETRLSDSLIARRSQGSKKQSIIALTQGNSKKRKVPDADASAGAQAPQLMYATKNKSPIGQPIAMKRKRPPPKGSGAHIPNSEKTFCSVCNWHVKSKKRQCYVCSGPAACDADARPVRFYTACKEEQGSCKTADVGYHLLFLCHVQCRPRYRLSVSCWQCRTCAW